MSKPINDGGPAFPTSPWQAGQSIGDDGMTLRDYFAAVALQGMIGTPLYDETGNEEAACLCYQQADAMLVVRKWEVLP